MADPRFKEPFTRHAANPILRARDLPCRARADEWVFAPEENHETIGDVDKVVFSCGSIAEGNDIRLYYGGADKSIALAAARMSERLDWLAERNRRDERG